MTVSRYFEISLTIPDNEARTALAVLRRLGVELGALERADVYRFDVDADRAGALETDVRGLETIFNPSKHALRVRTGERPETGELWVAEDTASAPSAAPRAAGRILAGVTHVARFVSWRMRGADGEAADSERVRAASEHLLCNPAFQKATTA